MFLQFLLMWLVAIVEELLLIWIVCWCCILYTPR
jgi:hypothetical protein